MRNLIFYPSIRELPSQDIFLRGPSGDCAKGRAISELRPPIIACAAKRQSTWLTEMALIANLHASGHSVHQLGAGITTRISCPMIDLHVHTTMSDGTFSPEEVVRKAAETGIKAIAVTDHDTVAGVTRARAEGVTSGIEVVAGVEVSTHREHGILHILGYFVNCNDPELLCALEYLRNGRRERIPKIISKLRNCGVHVSEAEVYDSAAGGVPGRPHVATVLVRKHYVSTLQDAFDRYLRRGAPAYVDKAKLSPHRALSVITQAGGLPVLAHPYSLKEDDPNRLEKTIMDLMTNGLKGIEAYYPVHTPQQTRLYLRLASRFNLAVTGGTDFHGSNKPDIELGIFPGGDRLPYSILEDLQARLHGRVSPTA